MDSPEGPDMKLIVRAQMDLFAPQARPPELISSERQEAVALLRALLMEAVANPAGVPSSGGEKEAGHE
jgi:hypothetical protein